MKKSIIVEIFEKDLKKLTQIIKVLQDNNLLTIVILLVLILAI